MKSGVSAPVAPTAAAADEWVDGSWTVDCSCGVKFDDGEEMVSCDSCGVWVHTRCARFVKLKLDQSFSCHNCKPPNPNPNPNPPSVPPPAAPPTPATVAAPAPPATGEEEVEESEETEVAQLLVELPLKTGPGPAGFQPVRKWEVPLREKVHVQGVPGGDPALFQTNSLTSAFNPNLWRCTGYIPKKFGFRYVEFPCWTEGRNVAERDGLSRASQGADALFALSKQAELAAVAAPQNVVRKGFRLGDSVERVGSKKKDKEKEKERERVRERERVKVRELAFGESVERERASKKKKKKDEFGERKDKRKRAAAASLTDVKITCEEREREMGIEELVVPEGKSETKMEDGLVESNLSDHDVVGESFGDMREEMEINKVSAEGLLNLSNVAKVLDDNVNVNVPDLVEKTETNQSNEVQEKVKDESKQEATHITTVNNTINSEQTSDVNKTTVESENNNTHHSTEEPKTIDNNNYNKQHDTVQDDGSTSQHDISKSEPGTDESNTAAPIPKPSVSPDPLVHRGPGPSSLTKTESTEQSKERCFKNPIIYHAKTSASSLHKSSQASKITSSCVNTGLKSKPAEPNLEKHVVKLTATCHAVDESTSSTSRKQVSDAPVPPANLSDEQLALLLHQQLNSSPRVPRVPRLRQTPGVQTAHQSSTSVLSKRSSRDHLSVAKKKLRGEEAARESSRDSSGLNDGTAKGLNKSTGQSKSTSVSKDSDKKVPAQQSPTVSSTEAGTSNPLVEPGDCTSQKYPSLPGLIDDVLNATPNVTYEEICRNVSMHWNNLRKPNGERYAYSSPTHAVHDILRNRKEWVHLIDQAPKAYLTKKRKNVITEEKKANKSEQEKSEEESESGGKDLEFPKGKRKARKRRRLELRGNKNLREEANKGKSKERNSGSENSSGPSDSSSDDDEGKDDDEESSSDDVSGAQTAGSSSSD